MSQAFHDYRISRKNLKAHVLNQFNGSQWRAVQLALLPKPTALVMPNLQSLSKEQSYDRLSWLFGYGGKSVVVTNKPSAT